MFAAKPIYSTLNPHLPPIRRNARPPPTPSFNTRAAKAAHIAENVSALKAKYMDYTVWLKNTSRNNREPILRQELLKNSLCRMGIDSDKAEQLVTTCSWYVYQFERDLQIHSQQKKIPINSIEMKKSTLFKNKPKKTMLTKDNIEDSTATISSLEQDDSLLSISRTNQFVLPPIQVSESSRPRRVDFDDKKRRKPLQKLKPISSEPVNSLPPLSLNSSSSSSRRHGLVTGGQQTRSILRKQPSISPSSTSTELTQQQKLITPSSVTTINDIPLGTRSQRLFGGSECFAQILNELEQNGV